MSSKYLQPIRGMKDLLPCDFKIHNYIINTASSITKRYGYEPMNVPIMEYASVFDRSLGDTSDVVSKEMYTFLDRNNELLSLRPEFTASIIRSFISNKLFHSTPLKFFSYGPVFRYDRPQAGRQRQFHQINCEYIGVEGALSDAEIIKLAIDILNTLGILDKTVLEINSLGCKESREQYSKALVDYFTDCRSQLSEISLKRLEKNPLRILDSKDKNDQELVRSSPLIANYYSVTTKNYFEQLLEYLDLLGVKYVINPRLVRGLDYYCHTAFEFIAQNLGSQSTILAGGRYDGLSEIMNGPHTPAIGFAAGIERIALMKDYKQESSPPVVVMPIAPDNLNETLMLSDKLRSQNICVLVDTHGKLSKRLSKAVTNGIKYIIFIGEDEEQSKCYKLKDLDTQSELYLNLDQIVTYITKKST